MRDYTGLKGAGSISSVDWTKLREPFTVDKVYQRQGPGGKMLDFVAIETVLARLLEHAPGYSWRGDSYSFTDGLAIVSGHLEINGKEAFGIGAMKNADPDMALKSANSEAIKNAAKNGFGIALELWDADHRASIAEHRRIAAMTEPQLKKEAYRVAKASRGVGDLGMLSAAEVAEALGIEPGALADADALREALTASA